MKILLLTCILFSICTYSIAQQEKIPRWAIAFTYGLAVPIGSFSKVAPEKSITTNSFGFDKEGNSAAINGQFISLDFIYHLSHHWIATLNAHHSINSVNTKPVLDYINNIYDPDFSSIHNSDYRVTSLAIGPGYKFYFKKLSFTLTPLIGIAKISPPDYNFEFLTTQYSFAVSDLTGSIMLGVNCNINYQINSKFYIGLKVDFNSANFDYTVPQRIAGSNPSTKSDKISYRLLKTGLTFGIML